MRSRDFLAKILAKEQPERRGVTRGGSEVPGRERERTMAGACAERRRLVERETEREIAARTADRETAISDRRKIISDISVARGGRDASDF